MELSQNATMPIFNVKFTNAKIFGGWGNNKGIHCLAVFFIGMLVDLLFLRVGGLLGTFPGRFQEMFETCWVLRVFWFCVRAQSMVCRQVLKMASRKFLIARGGRLSVRWWNGSQSYKCKCVQQVKKNLGLVRILGVNSSNSN